MLQPRLCIANVRSFQQVRNQCVMRVHVPVAVLVWKANNKIFPKVFFVQSQPTFELNLQEIFAVDVLSDEVCALPVVSETKRYKAVVSQDG